MASNGGVIVILRGDKRVWTPVGLACNCPYCNPKAYRAWKLRQRKKGDRGF